MAKEKKKIGDLLKSSNTKTMSPEEIEKATKQIKGGGSTEKEKTKRLSVDTPISLYIALKKKVAEEDTTIREFVIEQIRKGIE